MVNDTVREELETKIERISGPLRKPPVSSETQSEDGIRSQAAIEPAPTAREDLSAPVPTAKKRSHTTEFPPKQTNPTLVDFQPKSPTLPDWRLQIQNSVRKRADKAAGIQSEIHEPVRVKAAKVSANGVSAEAVVQPDTNLNQNPTIANALRRIEESRRAYLPELETAKAGAPAKAYPFNVVSRNQGATTVAGAPAPKLSPGAKPRLVPSLKIEKKKYDTNRLPKLPEVVADNEAVEPRKEEIVEASLEQASTPSPVSTVAAMEMPLFEPELSESNETLTIVTDEEYDDLAPFSVRFGAGLFDIVLGIVGTLLILSPFMTASERWFSLFGGLAFFATLAMILFLYLTASLSLWGRSLGMRVFSLELIDAEQSTYPTVHQAAVNSAVYLLSIVFFGLGFLTIIFNEEKRAFHDIVSGTILIRDLS